MLARALAVLDEDDRRHLQRITDLLLAELAADGPGSPHLCRFCDLADCPEGTCPVTDRFPSRPRCANMCS